LGPKQRLEPLPLLVSQFMSVCIHMQMYTDQTGVCKHALVLDSGAKPASFLMV
jgi:hypothetical protein